MPGEDPVPEPRREPLDLRLDPFDLTVVLGLPVERLGAVAVAPGGVPAGRRPGRVGDRLLAD